MSSLWQPLGQRRDGMIAVSIAALISVVSILTLMLFCTYLLRAHYRLSPLERLNSRSRAATFLLSDFFPIFCSLICGDLLQAIGFSLNVRWVAKDAFPLHPDSTCTAQAVLIQIGDVSSAFGSLLIGVHIALLLVLGIKIKRRILNYTIGFQWIVYGWAGGWCWISSHPSYQPFKLWLHYLWVFATAGVNLALYGAIFIKLARGNKLAAKHGGGGGTAAAARIMLFYPLVYIATIAPLGSFRIAALLGHTWSIHVQLAAGCIFTLSGFANCAVYAVTRNIVSSDTVNTVRRASVADMNKITARVGGIRRASVEKLGGRGSRESAPNSFATFSLSGVRPSLDDLVVVTEPLKSHARKVSWAGEKGPVRPLESATSTPGGSFRRGSDPDSLELGGLEEGMEV